MTQDPQMVEAVARAMHPRTWKHFLRHAELALEASHHAELVAKNARLREQLYLAEETSCQLEAAVRKLRGLVAMYVKDAPAIQETDELLAKIGCDQ